MNSRQSPVARILAVFLSLIEAPTYKMFYTRGFVGILGHRRDGITRHTSLSVGILVSPDYPQLEGDKLHSLCSG